MAAVRDVTAVRYVTAVRDVMAVRGCDGSAGMRRQCGNATAVRECDSNVRA